MMPRPSVAAVLSAVLALAGSAARADATPPRETAAPESARRDDPLAAVPPMTGEVVFAEGSFFGYVPPRTGDRCRIDFAGVAAVETGGIGLLGVGAEGEAAPYVVLPGPLTLERVHRTRGTLEGFRLTAEGADGRRLVIDVALSAGDEGRPTATAWLLEERGPIRSAALVRGELAAMLPDGWGSASREESAPAKGDIEGGAVAARPAPRLLTLAEAVAIAERHVAEKRIDVSGSHLASAALEKTDGPPTWVVTWRSDRAHVDGGWFAIHVGPDGSAEAFHGE